MEDQTTPPQHPNEHPVSIQDELRTSYLDYAMSVIIGRAIPDVRDGLKPVHRRILYAMRGAEPAARRRRTASAPRSSATCSATTTRTATPASTTRWCAWPRASRCATRSSTARATSARSTATRPRPTATPSAGCRKIAVELLSDIEKETVDFIPNFDDSREEPTVLPARFPNLLVNGSGGIAVGMATNIPPHNLGEVVDATIHLIQNPESDDRRA